MKRKKAVPKGAAFFVFVEWHVHSQSPYLSADVTQNHNPHNMDTFSCQPFQ
jgi:hypothetical protein